MHNRTLGLVAAPCAPALLADVITGGGYRPVVMGIASMVFLADWSCSNTAMRRAQAAGTGALMWVLLGLAVRGRGEVVTISYRAGEYVGAVIVLPVLLGTAGLGHVGPNVLGISGPARGRGDTSDGEDANRTFDAQAA